MGVNLVRDDFGKGLDWGGGRGRKWGTRCACFCDMVTLLISSWVCVSATFCLALVGAAARPVPRFDEEVGAGCGAVSGSKPSLAPGDREVVLARSSAPSLQPVQP